MSDNNETALAQVETQAVTAYQPQPGFTRDQIELIKTTIAKGVTDDELKLFISTAERRGLDPFARQIYAVKRKNRKTGVEEMTIQVAIDGLRAIADRHGKYAGQVGPFWCGPDGVWRDVWIDRDYPVAASVGVLRHDFSEPLYAVALWTEYCPYHDGKPERMWQQYPSIMLAKCAEALALRKAFPEQMGGLYTSDEMSIANAERVAQPEPPSTNDHDSQQRNGNGNGRRDDDGVLRNNAKYAGECATCRRKIAVGDAQVYDRGTKRSYHPDCYDKAVGKAVAEEVGTDPDEGLWPDGDAAPGDLEGSDGR